MPVAIKQRKKRELKCGKYVLPLSGRTLIMGILNRTPDSFSDGGNFTDDTAAIRHAEMMARDGADIIDVGGESTRPGSEPVGLQEELDRTIPIIERIAGEIDIPVSIDTSKHEVALHAIRAGATMVNDVTGLRYDPAMAGVISRHDVAVSVMHMQGTPKNMQESPNYRDLMGEVSDGLRESIDIALARGIQPDKIIVDPGIGFGKTVAHNLSIIRGLKEIEALGFPILIGVSRKSFIGSLLGCGTSRRLAGSLSASVIAIANGADILRAHDVKETRDLVRMTDALIEKGL
ncbi:MAG: dihydropteroate synthase [Omnitrophica bacterium]|nr:dihydropteroate synthase [Candidatus Omnitrophota bacterium]